MVPEDKASNVYWTANVWQRSIFMDNNPSSMASVASYVETQITNRQRRRP